MIKTLIKYIITDYAIGVFFDQVYDNFVKPTSVVDHIRFLSHSINTHTRKIASNYVLENQQDISILYGSSIESLLHDMIYRELEMDIHAITGVDYGKAGGDYSVSHDSEIMFLSHVPIKCTSTKKNG